MKEQMSTSSNQLNFYDIATRVMFVLVLAINIFLLYRYFTKRDKSLVKITDQSIVNLVETKRSIDTATENKDENTPLISQKTQILEKSN